MWDAGVVWIALMPQHRTIRGWCSTRNSCDVTTTKLETSTPCCKNLTPASQRRERTCSLLHRQPQARLLLGQEDRDVPPPLLAAPAAGAAAAPCWPRLPPLLPPLLPPPLLWLLPLLLWAPAVYSSSSSPPPPPLLLQKQQKRHSRQAGRRQNNRQAGQAGSQEQ